MQRLYHFDNTESAAEKSRSVGCDYFVVYGGVTFSCHRSEKTAWRTAHKNNGPSSRPTVWKVTGDGAKSVGACGPISLARRFPIH